MTGYKYAVGGICEHLILLRANVLIPAQDDLERIAISSGIFLPQYLLYAEYKSGDYFCVTRSVNHGVFVDIYLQSKIREENGKFDL